MDFNDTDKKVFFLTNRNFVGRIINGCLVGMVSICGGCGYYYPGHSIIVSSVAGCIYVLISILMVKLKIDDPLDAVAVHAGGGMYNLDVFDFFPIFLFFIMAPCKIY